MSLISKGIYQIRVGKVIIHRGAKIGNCNVVRENGENASDFIFLFDIDLAGRFLENFSFGDNYIFILSREDVFNEK